LELQHFRRAQEDAVFFSVEFLEFDLEKFWFSEEVQPDLLPQQSPMECGQM
jgi:hypothetical protein